MTQQRQLEVFPVLVEIPGIAKIQTLQRQPITYSGAVYSYAQIDFGLLDWSAFLQQTQSTVSVTALLATGGAIASSLKLDMLNNGGLLGYPVNILVFRLDSPDNVTELLPANLHNSQRRIIQESRLGGQLCTLILEVASDAVAPWTSTQQAS